ncbi:AmmeMemoRadiSam system protein A [Thiomicrorhabdus sp. zzn3]|uniref:AmmeMemoRadiSam system protein A n=1 Tax=Thiomicrorhabdus sp. zzn3 TaxID=3039775 RepID=UPI002436F8F1|nr:AmmeMemoRadiSam system protein A [Thiomicrorhabdus sp. zzn3]MDG6777958.1 AmmeMemoRadiSam system protein A [Thiomicrorhabdus sp. zzn3]
MRLNDQQQGHLLQIAKHSIRSGLANDSVKQIESTDTKLNRQGASFVTINQKGQLRGCIGTLEAQRPLIEDVAANAYSAAFRDPRFSPLNIEEVVNVELHISVLSQPELMHGCERQADLLDQLVAYEDGLIISQGMRRATFLPSVWEQLPDKQAFVSHLMRKAGIVHWDKVVCERYRSFSFGAHWQAIAETQ